MGSPDQKGKSADNVVQFSSWQIASQLKLREAGKRVESVAFDMPGQLSAQQRGELLELAARLEAFFLQSYSNNNGKEIAASD